MEFKDNFISVRGSLETASRYMIDPELKVHLNLRRPIREEDDGLFEVTFYHDPNTRADRLLQSNEPSEYGRTRGEKPWMGPAISPQRKEFGSLLLDAKPTHTKERPGEYVIKLNWDVERFELHIRALRRDAPPAGIPIVAAHPKEFIIYLLNALTKFEHWDEEMRKCKTAIYSGGKPFYEVLPTKLTFIIQKSLADCLTAISGQKFEDIGNGEVIYSQRGGQL